MNVASWPRSGRRKGSPTILPTGEYFQMVMQAVRTRAQLSRTDVRENGLRHRCRTTHMKALRTALPFGVRGLLLAGMFSILVGAGLIAYRLYLRPTTLTVAVGSSDGDGRQIAAVIAGRLATANSPIRLRVENSGNALDAAKAFAAGTADLAIVQADSGDLRQARAVALTGRGRPVDRSPAGIGHHGHRQAARAYRRRGRRRGQSWRHRGAEEGI